MELLIMSLRHIKNFAEENDATAKKVGEILDSYEFRQQLKKHREERDKFLFEDTDALKLFSKKQDLFKMARELNDLYLTCVCSFDFDKAGEIQVQIDNLFTVIDQLNIKMDECMNLK